MNNGLPELLTYPKLTTLILITQYNLLSPIRTFPINLPHPLSFFITTQKTSTMESPEQRRHQGSEHSHPDSSQSMPEYNTLPFDLHVDPCQFNVRENLDSLLHVFPWTERVDFDTRVLVYRFSRYQLPPKPWPKKVAGVPCYLTDDPKDRGPVAPAFRPASSQIKLSEELDCRSEAAASWAFESIRSFCLGRDIAVTEIQFWGKEGIIIVLADVPTENDILRRVPQAVGYCKCYYVFESEMARPQKLAAKHVEPPLTRETNFFSYDMETAGTRIGDKVFLDRGLLGELEGYRGPLCLLKIPIVDAGPSDPESIWIRCRWDYMGQSSHHSMRAHVPFSLIFNVFDQAVGVFRYAPIKGLYADFCLSTTADQVDGKYRIV